MGKHGFREIHGRRLEFVGEMVEEVPAAGAEFEETQPAGAETGAEFAVQAGALVRVVLRGAHERPEMREIGVEAVAGRHGVAAYCGSATGAPSRPSAPSPTAIRDSARLRRAVPV